VKFLIFHLSSLIQVESAHISKWVYERHDGVIGDEQFRPVFESDLDCLVVKNEQGAVVSLLPPFDLD
jgi:hypothetical protein